MSRLLGIAFTASDIAPIGGLAEALGLEFDIVTLCAVGEVQSEAHSLFVAEGASSVASDTYDRALADFAKSYSHIAAVSSMASKDLAPRLAARLDCAMVTDVTKAFSSMQFRRPYQAGAALATVTVMATPVVLTFRPAGFPGPETANRPEQKTLDLAKSQGSEILESRNVGQSRPDLSQAKVVVSGGRPLRDAETFERVIGGFADAFGGAVGATRAAVDSGIAPNEAQVGQTGKIVAPDLYVAAGISGSTQHMAGIKDSKLIVAINKDPDAPIFESADLGIVGDLYEVLPVLQEQLKNGK